MGNYHNLKLINKTKVTRIKSSYIINTIFKHRYSFNPNTKRISTPFAWIYTDTI